jgi:hypothetical protein
VLFAEPAASRDSLPTRLGTPTYIQGPCLIHLKRGWKTGRASSTCHSTRFLSAGKGLWIFFRRAFVLSHATSGRALGALGGLWGEPTPEELPWRLAASSPILRASRKTASGGSVASALTAPTTENADPATPPLAPASDRPAAVRLWPQGTLPERKRPLFDALLIQVKARAALRHLAETYSAQRWLVLPRSDTSRR